MTYIQLNADGTFNRRIDTTGNVHWDERHICPADKLTPDEAALFRVVPLAEITQPSFDPATQTVAQDGVELAGDQWQTKWVISQLDDATIAARAAAKVQAQKNSILDQIAVLEFKQHRAVRETVLGVSGSLVRLTALDAEIVALREQLK